MAGDVPSRGRPFARPAALALACALLLACGGGRDAPRAATPPSGAAVPTAGRSAGVPILLYHHVAAAPRGARSRALWVGRRRFRRQIAALARAGYHGVTLGRVWRHWHGGAPLPRRPVVVSFDDGYASQWANARPVLRRHRWPGVLNLQWDRLGARGGIGRAQLRALLRAGWEVGDHSLTHPDLTRVSPARLHAEVARSRTLMQRQLGVPVDFFCYPYGHVDGAVVAAVRAAGFLGATTTVRGLASPDDDPYTLNRIIVSGTTSPARLLRLLRRAR